MSSAARRVALVMAAVMALAAAGAGFANYSFAAYPVSRALAADSRNAGFTLRAHLGRYVDPRILVLDLRKIRRGSPMEVMRGVFEAAEAVHASGRRFDRVVLERRGTPVFFLTGDAFDDLGARRARSTSPALMIRKFPSKLYRLDGKPAFGIWAGDRHEVPSREMYDAWTAMAEWAGQRRLPQ